MCWLFIFIETRIVIRPKEKKKKYVSSIAYPKTAMHSAVFIINFINRKTAVCNLCINRTGKYVHTQTIPKV